MNAAKAKARFACSGMRIVQSWAGRANDEPRRSTMGSFILDPAQFSAQQRAWWNGFVCGLVGMRPEITLMGDQATNGIEIGAMPAAVENQPENYPWHDPALPIVDRMALASGQPFEQKLMAAMAQLDCGSCGYLCHTYSKAIACGEETNLTLCRPGGRETKLMIKSLLKASDHRPAARPGSVRKSNTSVRSRQNPFHAKLIESRPLNKAGSAKDTRHVMIDLRGSGLKYQVGDALGVYPTNCPELAALIIRRMSASPEFPVDTPVGTRKSLAQALLEDCCLGDPSGELLELLVRRASSPQTRHALQALIADGVPAGCDVLDLLTIAVDVPVGPQELLESLEPLNPRLYSIASSMRQVGEEVHLTVGKVTYQRLGRQRKGVASTMLADRVRPGERLRVFVQPNQQGFTVPQNPAAPMIMVGPGTGIAPFLAFLQERAARRATGKNWLFFGDQHEATDFLYQAELQGYLDQGLLDRLDTAFSRDGDQKLYVQHRMREQAAELWQWICKGAYFFVCGDAAKMALDVHRTLIEIVEEQASMSSDRAQAYVEKLSSQRRYVRDVY